MAIRGDPRASAAGRIREWLGGIDGAVALDRGSFEGEDDRTASGIEGDSI